MQHPLSLTEAGMAQKLALRRQHAGALPWASFESKWRRSCSQVGAPFLVLTRCMRSDAAFDIFTRIWLQARSISRCR